MIDPPRLAAALDGGAALAKVEREWAPLGEAIRPLIAAADPLAQDVEIAVNKAVARIYDLTNKISAFAGTAVAPNGDGAALAPAE